MQSRRKGSQFVIRMRVMQMKNRYQKNFAAVASKPTVPRLRLVKARNNARLFYVLGST